MHKMQEFLLWRNCTNQCDFCWQCKKQDPLTYLNEKEMIHCINEVMANLENINDGDDVLLVGGEILATYYQSVNEELHKLIDKCVAMLKQDKIRFLYINTNLIYKDKTNLIYLLNKVEDIENRLKFTTSYDIYGRFKKEEARELFLSNLKYIHDNYPKINVVVNSIITKQLVESDFDFDSFKEEYGIRYINFIPYIPVQDDRAMDVTFKDIVKVLAKNEAKQPGYINFYINDLDFNQDKVLYEYYKNQGFKECTSKYSDCHHNENFKKVLKDECYICKLKEVFR